MRAGSHTRAALALTNSMLVFLGAALAGAASLGCDRSCGYYFRCDEIDSTGGSGGDDSGGGGTGGAAVNACPDDPADGPVAEECGVWVTASWGDDGNHGTQAEPVATLAQAILRAKEGTGRIYACGEAFSEVVNLPSGISLMGGFSCEAGSWAYVGQDRAAIIAPLMPLVAALTVVQGEEPGERTSLLSDLHVEAPDALAPGASSIAVLTHESARVLLKRSLIIAGDGADGANGEDGDHDGAPAQSGLPGNDGGGACLAGVGVGGLAVKLECDGLVTLGGSGGDGGNGFANDGQQGLQPPDMNVQGYGAGGVGQDAPQGAGCTGGIAGKHGNSGIDGAGAMAKGWLGVDGFTGASGADGFAGLPGQGGGGGGGSIGGAACGVNAPKGGAGGGSGGTGGCGGEPGKGGQAGGSSIGLVILGRDVKLVASLFVAGRGGSGGNGGAGQLGGQGGFPGLGGMVFGGAQINPACPGGVGGPGGNGGNGGGGRGGHSVGVAFVTGNGFDTKVDTVLGQPGPGGKGGNPDLVGADGADGTDAPVQSFP